MGQARRMSTSFSSVAPRPARWPTPQPNSGASAVFTSAEPSGRGHAAPSFTETSEPPTPSKPSGSAISPSAVKALSTADGSVHPEPGVVDAVESEFDRDTGSLALRARFPNAKGRLKHGGTATVLVKKAIPSALLVPPDNPGALASALDRLDSDRELAASLGRAARALASEYTWEKRARRLEAALEAARPA